MSGSGPTREQLTAWDDTYVWHPFTPHSVYRNEDPLMIERAEGHYLIDVDGRRLLDGVASLWCSVLGHRRPEIDAAVIDQLSRVAHCTYLGNANVPATLLAKRLVELAPDPLTRVFFSDNGSTATEIALKMAYQYQQQRLDGDHTARTRFLTVGNAYHGDTVGAVSLGSIPLFHRVYKPLLFDTVTAPSPYCYRCPLQKERATCQLACLDALEALAHEHADTLAAVVLEPLMQGAAGMITQPEGYVRRVREICDDIGALLILDEVAVGLGRTGAMFACQHEDVVPDLLCLAKGLTGGYLPLAATLATEAIFEAFLGPPEDARTFFHGHTYTGNPLGAAAALAALDVYEEHAIVAAVQRKTVYLAHKLEALRGLPAVGDIRQIGLAAGIELVADKDTRAAYPSHLRIGQKVCLAAREKGVFLRPLGDVVVLMPALTIEPHELDRLVDAIAYGIQTVCAA